MILMGCIYGQRMMFLCIPPFYDLGTLIGAYKCFFLLKKNIQFDKCECVDHRIVWCHSVNEMSGIIFWLELSE